MTSNSVPTKTEAEPIEENSRNDKNNEEEVLMFWNEVDLQKILQVPSPEPVVAIQPETPKKTHQRDDGALIQAQLINMSHIVKELAARKRSEVQAPAARKPGARQTRAEPFELIVLPDMPARIIHTDTSSFWSSISTIVDPPQEKLQAPSPAMYLDCGGSGPATSWSIGRTSRKRMFQSQKTRGSAAKRSQKPTSSTPSIVRRPLRDAETGSFLNYGSEEDSEDDPDEDEIGPQNVRDINRVARAYLGFDEQVDNVQVDTDLCFSWPPQPLRSSPGSLIPSSDQTSSEPCSTTAFPVCSMSPISLMTPSTSQNLNKFDFNWREFPQPQISPELRREAFSKINTGPTVPLATPYEAFTAIWDRDIMEHIATETNAYAQQVAETMLQDGAIGPSSRISRWVDTDADELLVYFALILATGVVVKSRLEEYWNSAQDIFSTPGFSASMSSNRYTLLSKCLHFQNNSRCDPETMTRSQAKLYKVQPILDHLNNKFSQLYNLNQNIALDESLTMWKGLLDMNQFIRNKAAAIGIKTYELCEAQTGYLWRFEVHAGHDEPQEDSPISGIVPALVLRLLNGLEHKGHTIWMDNFYNSPALARELKVRGFDCAGTLRTDRQFVPVELTNLKETDMAVGQVVGCTSGDVDLLVWRHNKRVAFVSTYHGLATTMCGDTRMPTVVPDYNVCMGGVDLKDQMLAMYPIERRRNRIWYKKFFRRLLNASILNAYILYKHSHPKTHTHRTFRKALVTDLLVRHNRRVVPPVPVIPIRPTVGHFPAQYSLKPDTTKREHIRRSCVFCKKRTNVYCIECATPLCVFTCFQPFHKIQGYCT